MKTCTWAPTTFAGTSVVGQAIQVDAPTGNHLTKLVSGYVKKVETLQISHLLIPQRWWGNAREIEGSSLDCLAMTPFIAACTSRLNLVTAVHPGFFEPAVVAKFGATLSCLTQGRWSINVTSGWNLDEFKMYGIDALTHDERYLRSAEFIRILKGAWSESVFSYQGQYYSVDRLALEPKPVGDLVVFQGGQSEAAIDMAVKHSDWMFLNGGSLEQISETIRSVREAAQSKPAGRCPRFAVYGIPVCRPTDEQAGQVIQDMLANINRDVLAARKKRLEGASGMWAAADELRMLDTNEGYATGLIGSPATIVEQAGRLKAAGVDMLHLALGDELFEQEALPEIVEL